MCPLFLYLSNYLFIFSPCGRHAALLSRCAAANDSASQSVVQVESQQSEQSSKRERERERKPCSLESGAEDRGVFEEQTERELKASSHCRRRRGKKKQGGEERKREINDKHPLLTSFKHERSSLAELCGGPVATSQQAAAASSLASPASVSVSDSLPLASLFFFFSPTLSPSDLLFKAKLAPYLCANLLLGPTRVACMLNLSFLGFSRLSCCSLWSLSP